MSQDETWNSFLSSSFFPSTSFLPGVPFVRLWERAAGLIEISVGCNCSAKPQWSTSPKWHLFLFVFSSASFYTLTKSAPPVSSSLISSCPLF